MKTLCALALLLLAGIALGGITGTNLLSVATYPAGTTNSVNYIPPQTHQMAPHTITIYHSTNSPVTNYLEASFDGGVTWTVVASYITSTNAGTEIWTPNLTTLYATNRIRTATGASQTLFIQGNWVQ